jgi:parallel beta-helix repeat protein
LVVIFDKISFQGGRVIAVDNVITNNQFHGVAIGPRGSAILERNIIENNNQDGICCYGSMDNKLAMFGIPKEESEQILSKHPFQPHLIVMVHQKEAHQ